MAHDNLTGRDGLRVEVIRSTPKKTCPKCQKVIEECQCVKELDKTQLQ